MQFLDRTDELARLDALLGRSEAGLAVVYGRRRIGKTRLLVQWVQARGGAYTVADLSSPEVQRRWFASALADKIPGIADATWPDWAGLLRAVARGAAAEGWRGPIVLDELPYLVAASPELPSVLQRWVDHEAREAGLVVAIAGSSQRMMQGLALDASQPLFGRAHEILRVLPLDARFARDAASLPSARDVVAFVTAWGGVPRYWELAVGAAGTVRDRIDALVLDPLGPLHDEPDRLLLEELPPAAALRPLLDAIGAGAHRLSEIAGRLGRTATAMSRPLGRLIELGLVRREVPAGEPALGGKRSLYRIQDPFLRLWFRVVAPARAQLAVATVDGRLSLLDRHWAELEAATWEELCRRAVPRLDPSTPLGALGPWGPASRWWHGNAAEWDVVAQSLDGKRTLLGEAKLDSAHVGAEGRRLAQRPVPPVARAEVVRALFVPGDPPSSVAGVHCVGGESVVG